MSREPLNDALARTSFLNGVNAPYIEEMQAQYNKNPGSVGDEWRLFFQSLREERIRFVMDFSRDASENRRFGLGSEVGLVSARRGLTQRDRRNGRHRDEGGKKEVFKTHELSALYA